MGWNSWNKFGTGINDKLIREIADAMASSGMRDAGYEYLVIDDGWTDTRAEDGSILPNDRFTNIKEMIDYVHSKGLKIWDLFLPRTKNLCRSYGKRGARGTGRQDLCRLGS